MTDPNVTKHMCALQDVCTDLLLCNFYLLNITWDCIKEKKRPIPEKTTENTLNHDMQSFLDMFVVIISKL